VEPWVVVVVRAWSEDGHLRARMVRAARAGEPEVTLVASPLEAANRLHDWLQELVSTETPENSDR
jgi:hypothetical protein